MHDARIFYLPAAILSACVLLAGAVARLLLGWAGPDWTVERIVDWGIGIVAAGFLHFVRKWIKDQEDERRKTMDTLRAHIEKQELFEREMIAFTVLVAARLGLHREDSDPALLIGGRRRGDPPKRLIEAKTETEKKESANPDPEEES